MSKFDSNKEHFEAALNHYDSILTILDYFELEIPFDAYKSFPEDWGEDPLLLLGQHLEILDFTETETDEIRVSTAEFIETNGPEWVWGNWMRLAAEMEFIRRFQIPE